MATRKKLAVKPKDVPRSSPKDKSLKSLKLLISNLAVSSGELTIAGKNRVLRATINKIRIGMLPVPLGEGSIEALVDITVQFADSNEPGHRVSGLRRWDGKKEKLIAKIRLSEFPLEFIEEALAVDQGTKAIYRGAEFLSGMTGRVSGLMTVEYRAKNSKSPWKLL